MKQNDFPGFFRVAILGFLSLGTAAVAFLGFYFFMKKPSAPDGFEIVNWYEVTGLHRPIAQFESVYWSPDATLILRDYFDDHPNEVAGRSVLDIGTGTGLLGLYALERGASTVVGTEVNPSASACAKFNASYLGFSDRFETRLVERLSSEAYEVIGEDERFDLIISNPPWHNRGDVETLPLRNRAGSDPGHELMESILKGVPDHLSPDGVAYLVYIDYHRDLVLQKAAALGLEASVLDERDGEVCIEIRFGSL